MSLRQSHGRIAIQRRLLELRGSQWGPGIRADTVATGMRQRGIRLKLIDCGFGNDPDPARGELTALHTAGVRRAKAQRLVVVRVGADAKVGYFLHLGEAVLR